MLLRRHPNACPVRDHRLRFSLARELRQRARVQTTKGRSASGASGGIPSQPDPSTNRTATTLTVRGRGNSGKPGNSIAFLHSGSMVLSLAFMEAASRYWDGLEFPLCWLRAMLVAGYRTRRSRRRCSRQLFGDSDSYSQNHCSRCFDFNRRLSTGERSLSSIRLTKSTFVEPPSSADAIS